MMKQLLGNSYLFGANAPFIEALYDAWLRDPAAVDARWRDYFEELQRVEGGAADVSHFEVQDRFANKAVDILGEFGLLESWGEEGKWVPLRGTIAEAYRDCRTGQIAAGTSEVQRNIIANRGLGLPKSY